MRALGHEWSLEGRMYLTGGACAVLLGWRTNTLDVDLKLIPDHSRLFDAIQALKEALHMNVELASPDDFIPVLPGWEERSPFITREAKLSFHHYDFYAQALAKIERDHELDRVDVRQMIESGLVRKTRLKELFEAIEPEIKRYPAINPRRFRAALEATIQ